MSKTFVCPNCGVKYEIGAQAAASFKCSCKKKRKEIVEEITKHEDEFGDMPTVEKFSHRRRRFKVEENAS